MNLAADGNGDDKVSAADYTVWRDHFGASLGAGSGVGVATPEPGSLTLIWLAIGGMAFANRQRIRTRHAQIL